MYTPAQVAKRANIHPNSVRNYAREYADLLSPGASGENGARLFTDEDMEILCAIAVLRKTGVPPGEVGERIRQRAAPVIDVSPQEPPQALQTPYMVPSIQHEGYNAIQGHVEALARRLDAQAAEQRAIQQDRLWMFGMGLWVGMVTMGLIFFAVWMVVNGTPW